MGLYADGGTQEKVRLQIRPIRPVTALRVRAWRPEYARPHPSFLLKDHEMTALPMPEAEPLV